MRYGYVRATRLTQGRTRQLAALHAAKCDRIVEEHGAMTRLQELGLLIAKLASGDVLLVSRADVLSSSYRRLFKILAAVEARGATFQALADDLTTAELKQAASREHSTVSMSISAGRQLARRRGVQLGRPAKMTPLQQQEAVGSWLAGEKVTEIAARYGVSRTVITGLTAAIRHGTAHEWAAGLSVAAQ